jgi:predicted DNA-binding transcriptional regulator AlpA
LRNDIPTSTTRPKQRRHRPTPIGLRTPDATAFVGVSKATWARLVAAGKTPEPIKLGGCTLFSRRVLARWIEMNCPDRATYSALVAAEYGRPR